MTHERSEGGGRSPLETLDTVRQLIETAMPAIGPYLKVHTPRFRVALSDLDARLPRRGNILDLGAAPFCLSETLARLGHRVVAADVRPDNWRYADALSFRLVQANCNGDALPFADNSFDAVLLTEVFEHLHHDLISSVAEIRRVLRPGGLLYLTTPNGFGLRRLCKVLRTRRFQKVYLEWSYIHSQGFCGHVAEYTPRELDEFFTQCGFADVRVPTRNVYRKKNLEEYCWRALTKLLPSMRETIILTAAKPAA